MILVNLILLNIMRGSCYIDFYVHLTGYNLSYVENRRILARNITISEQKVKQRTIASCSPFLFRTNQPALRVRSRIPRQTKFSDFPLYRGSRAKRKRKERVALSVAA